LHFFLLTLKTAEIRFCFTIIEKFFIHASHQRIIGLASINLVVSITYEKTVKKVAQYAVSADVPSALSAKRESSPAPDGTKRSVLRTMCVRDGRAPVSG